MRLNKLSAIPLALMIGVSVSFAQETETGNDQEEFAEVAKMLHGVWAGDADETAEEIKKMEDAGLDEDTIESLLDRVRSIELEFKDGTFAVLIGDQTMSGEWSVTAAAEKDDIQTLTIRIMPEDAEGVQKNFEVWLTTGSQIKMIDLDEEGPPFVMGRKTLRSNDQ
ncbi:MAG: hypothetical protein ACR2NP_07640 [Pirellulaceae bacterium]